MANPSLQAFTDSPGVKLAHQIVTVGLMPLLLSIQSSLSQIQVQQAVTANEISQIQSSTTQRDAELSQLRQNVGTLEARMAAMEALTAEEARRRP